MSKAQDKVRQADSMSILSGSLSTGEGTRFVLAATEHLHRRIAALGGRVRLLEDALMSLQASHPLLHPDLVAREVDDFGMMDDEVKGDNEDKDKAGGGDAIDAFGTLSISDHGISRFFGPTGGVESLLISNLSPPPNPSTPLTNSSDSSPQLHSSSLCSAASPPADPLALFSSSFPFTPLGSPVGVQDLIASHLPSRSTAEGLVQIYLSECSWLFHGVTKAQLEEMVVALYGRAGRRSQLREGEREGGEGDYSGPHDLALLFIIFAVGALVRPSDSNMGTQRLGMDTCSSPNSNMHSHSKSDPLSDLTSVHLASSPDSFTSNSHAMSTTSNNALGEHFHQLSRAALALQPVLEKPSLVTIQTLHLLSIYNAMSGSDLESETSMEMTWSLITLAGHLSMTIGLHRDSARWGLTPKMVRRRRILFWDLFVADVWQSLNTGRPPSFSLAYIDCSFPDAQDGAPNDGAPNDGAPCEGAEGGFGSAFSIWQCRFAAECVAEVTSRTLTAEAPTYATIMELDKKVRDFPLPEGMTLGDGKMKAKNGEGRRPEGEGGDLAGSFQRCVLDHIKETVLMYIHRSFFAQAIIEHPANPLKSAYAPSFLAAYRAASTILKSVVFGTVVTRGPKSPLAHSAMAELEQACRLFSKASVYSIRATKALPVLTKLAEKARHALSAAQKDSELLSDAVGGMLWNIEVNKEPDEDDELAIFAGHTRFVSGRKPAVEAPSSLPHQRQSNSKTVNGWPGRLESLDISPAEDPDMLSNLPPLPLHYPYAPSERATCDEAHGFTPSLWEEPSPQGVQLYSNQAVGASNQQQRELIRPRRIRSSRFYSTPDLHPPQQHQQFLYHHQLYTPHVQESHEYGNDHRTYPQQPQYQQHQSQCPQQQTMFAGNLELADLGLAARDSRLDERWSSFMHESGILEGMYFQCGNGR
ncbi:hypothetical protein C0992_003792 [Termitomyces sp. T32_za158]|nr:hypothetical protein C0992_003792 [Termitomyces sp. T32_za158]